MALLIRQKTVCPLCGRVIDADAEIVSTPAFLETSHRLARFSDGVFHRGCFDESIERAKVEQLLAEFKVALSSGPATLEEYEAWIKERTDASQAEHSGKVLAARPTRT